MAKSERIVEFVGGLEKGFQVNRESHEVSGVKLCGLTSKNGRVYKESALKAALGLYEGAKINVDHRTKDNPSRSYGSRLGVAKDVEYREGKGVYGTIKYNPKNPLAEQFLWDCENLPEACGFSHDVAARTSRSAGKLIVEEISEVNSVDLVADPATTKSVKEAVEGEPDETSIASMLETLQEGNHSKGRFGLLEFMQDIVKQNPDMGKLPMPPGVAAGPEAAPMMGQLDAAMEQMILATFKMLSPEEKKSLVTKMLNSSEETDPMADPEKKPEGEEEKKKSEEGGMPFEKKVEESLAAMRESLATVTKELDARKVLEAKGASPTSQLITELVECADKPAMEKLVEGWSPAKLGKSKPKIGSITEAVGEYPKDQASFVRQLKRGA